MNRFIIFWVLTVALAWAQKANYTGYIINFLELKIYLKKSQLNLYSRYIESVVWRGYFNSLS